MKGKRGMIKEKYWTYEGCLHLGSWNRDCVKSEVEDLPENCQSVKPAGTRYAGNRRTNIVVGIDA